MEICKILPETIKWHECDGGCGLIIDKTKGESFTVICDQKIVAGRRGTSLKKSVNPEQIVMSDKDVVAEAVEDSIEYSPSIDDGFGDQYSMMFEGVCHDDSVSASQREFLLKYTKPNSYLWFWVWKWSSYGDKDCPINVIIRRVFQ